MTGRQTKSASSRFSSGGFFRHVKYEHLVAGVSGGVSATLALHPLDLIKVRLQVHDGATADPHTSYNGVRHAFRSIITESGWRGLYQGVVPNIWGAGLAWGLYFFGFNFLKDWIKDDKKYTLTAKEHLVAASVTGVGTLTITNPIWVSKTRLIVQSESSNLAAKSAGFKYNGMLDTLYKTWRHEGIRGLYKYAFVLKDYGKLTSHPSDPVILVRQRGITSEQDHKRKLTSEVVATNGYIPGLFGVSHGALQFMAYEELKKLRSSYFGTPIDHKLSSIEYVMMAALSKIFASASTYPYQVIRSRLQDHYNIGRYNGVVDAVQKTWRVEGPLGFYKGLFPNLLRVTPACCITFVVYENILSLLQKQQKLN